MKPCKEPNSTSVQSVISPSSVAMSTVMVTSSLVPTMILSLWKKPWCALAVVLRSLDCEPSSTAQDTDLVTCSTNVITAVQSLRTDAVETHICANSVISIQWEMISLTAKVFNGGAHLTFITTLQPKVFPLENALSAQVSSTIRDTHPHHWPKKRRSSKMSIHN